MQHLQVRLRLLLGDRVTDLFREPVDIALRYGASQTAEELAGTTACCACSADGRMTVDASSWAGVSRA